MYTLKDNGIITEIECGSNFGYILDDSKYFVNTDYKVLQGQTNGVFVQCMKMLYNGKIELYYRTDMYRTMSSMFAGISADTMITIVSNLFADVLEVQNNGFLSSQNIDISWDKIFVDANTLQVKLVYLPINVKTFDNYATFENELRSGLIKLIQRVVVSSNDRMDQLVEDLANGSLTLEDLYNKSRERNPGQMRNNPIRRENGNVSIPTASGNVGNIRLVAVNAPNHFEIEIDKDEVLIGKKAELVDAAITYNNAISRKHCKIMRYGGNYQIVDVGSANGTYVNKVRIAPNQPCPIKRGDVIRLANSDFQIV